MERAQRVSLLEIFKVFFFIGATGFGGGMAIVSLTERVCVHEKKWVGTDEFMHGLAFGQILGPFSLNTCTFVGYYLRGPVGGVLAASAFIAPSFILVCLLSWLYFTFHELPQLQSALNGTNPVIIALIIVAAVGMGRSKVKGKEDWLMALAAFAAAALFSASALTILVAATFWSLGRSWYRREHR
ncbi:chromate transporter [Geomobilimonas luticola]|uniref:Chromate transporter n=1 Tax=Geomobilimonas luticola TaxID=1114878 RepID=A0ABS5SCX4_9BACT|nr:chromate transporter [Geomobilimonas luticola]MBT0653231.1 chromate transporter [Geomobilimonas luticola]